jgi:hypothetical protein
MLLRGKRRVIVAVAVVLASGVVATVALGTPSGWRVNNQLLGGRPGTFTSKTAKKTTIRLPETLEVVCEKVKSPAEADIAPVNGASLYIKSFSLEECNKVVDLETKEEGECEVENKAIQFNELGARIVWIEASGSEAYLYFDETFHNNAWEKSGGLWATIKIKSVAGKTCPSLLLGMHPLNGQMLAKLKLPTSEQVKKIFTSVESGGSCSRATTYYEGEPRTSHSSEGLTIGGEKDAELCGEFEIELTSGEEFAIT